jgi:hypothetical protein
MMIVEHGICLPELKTIAAARFGNMVKAVVDVARETLAIDAPLHADLEALLLNNGSKNEDLWGINLYPELTGDDWLEYDSMINIRPAQNNLTRGVTDPTVRQKIVTIVNKLVTR